MRRIAHVRVRGGSGRGIAQSYPANLALYPYSNNNPVRYTDPNGKDAGIAAWEHDEGRIDPKTKENLATLHPAIREQARNFIIQAKNAGIDVHVTSGLRSMKEQAAIYAQGRDLKGNIVDKSKVVSYAPPGSSYHNYGLAFDVSIVEGKKQNWDFSSTPWQSVGKLGEESGFEWGGSWTDFKDYPHFQETFGLGTGELKRDWTRERRRTIMSTSVRRRCQRSKSFYDAVPSFLEGVDDHGGGWLYTAFLDDPGTPRGGR